MVEEIKADTVTKDYISDPEIKVYAADKPLPEERGAYAHGSGGRRKNSPESLRPNLLEKDDIDEIAQLSLPCGI